MPMSMTVPGTVVKMTAVVLVLLLLLLLVASLNSAVPQGSAPQNSEPFRVGVYEDGGYDVTVRGVNWLSSGPTFFNNNGKRYCTGEGTLKLQGSTIDTGKDDFGTWNKTTFTYSAGELAVKTSVKVYTDPLVTVAVFSQTYVSDATKTQGSDRDDVISSFPSFRFGQGSRADLGFLGYGDNMAGWISLGLGKWNKDSKFSTGIQGGPLVLFDKGSNAIVISPLSKFMAASNKKFKDKHISWGIMGLVDSVPAGYTVDFIVSFSRYGVNQAMREWGSFITRTYGKTTKPRDSDPTLTHLGYWTDAGAYYYYNTEKGKNYEDTMIDTATYLKKQGLPMRYLQIDSWFYKKGPKRGTLTWEADQRVFPNGFKGLYDKTDLPIGCHNRFWDSETPYAKYNGGKYNFIPDKQSGSAVPDDQQFWFDLFNSTRSWGKFILYEQDHLNQQTDWSLAMLSDLDLGRRWLMQMGRAAEKFGISIQYCMSYSRHILQSVEIPAVTQARVSGDYLPGNDQYKIGITAMFADALNLGPSKDTFWSTTKQPGNPYKGKVEQRTELQARIATLSGGPVGPGDGIGYADPELLERCCDSDGKVLRGSRALTMMDRSLLKAAFGGPSSGGSGEVLYSAPTVIDGEVFGIIIANDIVGNYNLVPGDLSPGNPRVLTKRPFYVYNEKTGGLRAWDVQNPLPVNRANCGNRVCVFHATPYFQVWRRSIRYGLLGEAGKFAPVSPQRFSNLDFDDGRTGRLEVDVSVNRGETVSVRFFVMKDNDMTFEDVQCENRDMPGAVKVRAYVTSVGDKGCTR